MASQAEATSPTSDMPLDDIIRELEALRYEALEGFVTHIEQGILGGLVRIDRTDTDWDSTGIVLTMPSGSWIECSEIPHEFTRRRMELGIAYDNACDALKAARALRLTLEGRK